MRNLWRTLTLQKSIDATGSFCTAIAGSLASIQKISNNANKSEEFLHTPCRTSEAPERCIKRRKAICYLYASGNFGTALAKSIMTYIQRTYYAKKRRKFIHTPCRTFPVIPINGIWGEEKPAVILMLQGVFVQHLRNLTCTQKTFIMQTRAESFCTLLGEPLMHTNVIESKGKPGRFCTALSGSLTCTQNT